MPIQFPQKLECLFKPSRYKVLYGGRGGAKSWGIARALLLQGVQAKHKILCCREIQRSITESVHSLLAEQVEQLGLAHFYKITNTSIIGKNGTEFIFAGLRTNISNIKSIPGITRAWIEEAQTVSKSSMKVLIPTIRENGSEIWLSFNPELEDDDIYQDFVLNPPNDAIVVKIGYQDNPWFPDVLKQEMEDLKKRNFKDYLNVWEGECKQSVDGAIFAEELSLAAKEDRITRVPAQAGIPICTYWDLGQSDNTAIWFVQQVGLEFRIIDYFQSSGQKMPFYIDALAKKQYYYDTHFLPHDAEHDQLAAQNTIKRQLQDALKANNALGRDVIIVPRIARKTLGIDAARTIFAQCVFDRQNTSDGLQCLRHYAYAKDEDTGSISKEPKHDVWSHGADAFLCFAQHHKRPQVKHKPKPNSYPSSANSWMGA